MSGARAVAAILATDLRQRLRTPRFWLLIAGLAGLMWWCFPAMDRDYLTVSVGEGMRGRYSSAWIGMVSALMYSSTLSLAGFYLVRGTVVRDLETRTWQLLVATTMSRGAYLLAKWLSHMVVFALLIGAGLAVGLVAQMLRAEDLRIDLLELVKPVLVLTMPSLALTAALAVWFDLVPWLRRSAGNLLFFVVWVMLLTFGVSQAEQAPGAALPWPGDPHGLLVAEYDLSHAWPTVDAGKELGLSVGSQALEGKAPVLLDWTHWQLSAATLRARGAWLGLALVLLVLPAILRLAVVNPQAALSALVVGASLAAWGMATGVLFRNGRMFELALLALAYIGVQGGLLLNVAVAPMDTLRWHLLGLPLALAILAIGWPRMETR